MALDEIVPDLAELAPRDCAAAHRLVPPDQPIPEPPGGDVDHETPGTTNARMTARQARVASDIRSQREAIIAHRKEMMRQLGRIVSLDEAARDWIPQHAETWRSENETAPSESASNP